MLGVSTLDWKVNGDAIRIETGERPDSDHAYAVRLDGFHNPRQ
jgi:hypothetical protein